MVDLLNAIKFCVDVRDIMVFDEYSRDNICTKSLIYHMIHYAKDCEIIYLPQNVYIDCIPVNLNDIYDSFTIFGKTIERITESESLNYLNYYKSLGGALPIKKSNIVIATIYEGDLTPLNTVLGCY